MTKIVYDIIRHDGGWAFKLGDTISEPFPTREAALKAVRRVAVEQQRPGVTTGIAWEDSNGVWREEIASGDDRPEVEIHDEP